ncbi:MAG: TrmB family transcriptional regulator [Ruminiclostridium sp.]|nr:TrmB family transcriptional regulator [Ruminiclostridium sp.]
MKVLEALEKLGLTENESRAYTKLVEHGHLSAKEASKLTGIPYSKIYTTLISLVDKGWVSVKEGRPKKYRPIDPSFASDLAFKNQTEVLTDASKTISDILQSLYSEDTVAGKSEIWSIRGHANVLRKLSEIIGSSNHEIFCLLMNPDDSDLIQISTMIQEAKERGCKVLAYYKKSPEKEINPYIKNTMIVWESSHKITGRGIFLFADSKIIFLSSLDEKSIALWSNDLSLAEVVRNIASIKKLGNYSSCMSASAGKFSSTV